MYQYLEKALGYHNLRCQLRVDLQNMNENKNFLVEKGPNFSDNLGPSSAIIFRSLK
jgi:hypothetical protein